MMNQTNAQGLEKKLPVRPERYQDEWTETYLARSARAMGIRRPWRYDLEALRMFLPASNVENDDGRPTYGSELLPGWAVLGRQAQIRVCPQCFLENPYIRARWRIPFLTVCTVHGEVLKSGLVEPAITANYKRTDKHTVADAILDDVYSGAICPTPIGHKYALAIWGPFEEAVLSGASRDVVVNCLAWALLSERLLDAVVTSVRGPDYPSRDSIRHEHRGGWLSKEELKLSPDRNGVQAFILGLHIGAHRRAVISSLTRLIFDEHRRRTIMSRLPLAELKERLLAAHVGNNVGSCGALPRSMHPPECMSLEAVEAILGCHASLLHYMVREQHFVGVIQIQFGRKRYVFVPNKEVARVRRLLASCMTFSELLETLSIDKKVYLTLREAGLLSPITFGPWRRYSRQEVAVLLTRLDTISRPLFKKTEGHYPLMGQWLYVSRQARSCTRQLIHDILDGRIPVYRSLDGDGLAAYFVDHRALMQIRYTRQLHQATSVRQGATVDQLALWAGA